MNYIDKVASHIGDQCGMSNCMIDPEGSRMLRIYALLALTVGVNVTWKHVHDAWSAWRAQTWPDHPSLVPFEELSAEIQSLDAPYCDAIRSSALAIQEGRL